MNTTHIARLQRLNGWALSQDFIVVTRSSNASKAVVEDARPPSTAPPIMESTGAANGVGTIPSTIGNSLVCRNGQEIKLAALEFYYNMSKFGIVLECSLQ
jgi:hypothetical protein